MQSKNMIQWKKHQPSPNWQWDFVLLALPEAQSSHQQNGEFSYLIRITKIAMCAQPPTNYSVKGSDVMCVPAFQKAS